MTMDTACSARFRAAAAPAAALLMGLVALPAAATPAPRVISGKIEVQVVHVGAVPVAPKVSLVLHGETERVYLTFNGPGGQIFTDYFYTSVANGRHTFDGAGISDVFSPYTPAGTWTLTQVSACSSNRCNSYVGDALTPLFASLTFMVVNPHSDTTTPTITSAVVTTPTVATSDKSKIEVAVDVQDDVSGVRFAQVQFANASGQTILVGGTLTYLVKAATTYGLVAYCRCQYLTAGDFTARSVTLIDAAGNQAKITDAGQISTLFGGQPSFTLTN